MSAVNPISLLARARRSRILPPVFSLRECIDMADASNEIEDLAEKLEFELPILLRPLKARR